MGFLVGILIASAIAGGIWVYIIPMLTAQVPTSITSNKYAQVAVSGAFILLTIWGTLLALKAIGGRKVV